MLDVAVRHGTVVTPEGVVRADISIRDGLLAVLAAPGQLPAAERVFDVPGCYVLPGLVDPHTHPGNVRSLLEDIPSETRSAAVGGVTTMLGTVKVTRMRPHSPAITSLADAGSYADALPRVRQVVDAAAHVDLGFSFVVMTAEHAGEIPRCVQELGVTSFKFMVTFPPATDRGARIGIPVFPDDGVIFAGFRRCAETGALAMVHAENAQVVEAMGAELGAGHDGLEAWEARFPGSLEATEIDKAAAFARVTGARCYVAHVTSREGIAAVRRARALGTRLWAETCPQYLVLDLDRDRARGPLAKFNPPVRHREDREALWSGLVRGDIDAVGSDHVPVRRETKFGDGSLAATMAGSPGVATLLPLLWTVGVATGSLSPQRLVEIAATTPAKIFGLHPRKGAIQVGADADLVVVDPTLRRRVDSARLASWADFSAYEGTELTGWPVLTLLRGTVIAQDGVPVGDPCGRYLHRPLQPGRG